MSSATPSDPKSAERREQRRREILQTATKQFAKHGYADSDMESVAAENGIAKGTLYLYFPSKENLFFACVDAGMLELQTAVTSVAATTAEPLDRIAAAIRAYLIFFDQHPELVELFIQERANFKQRKRPSYFEHRDHMRGPWLELYERLQADLVIRSDINAERILDTIGSLVYGTMFTNFFTGREISLEEQFAAMFAIIQRGILTGDQSH